MSVDRSVSWSVCHNFLKERESSGLLVVLSGAGAGSARVRGPEGCVPVEANLAILAVGPPGVVPDISEHVRKKQNKKTRPNNEEGSWYIEYPFKLKTKIVSRYNKTVQCPHPIFLYIKYKKVHHSVYLQCTTVTSTSHMSGLKWQKLGIRRDSA